MIQALQNKIIIALLVIIAGSLVYLTADKATENKRREEAKIQREAEMKAEREGADKAEAEMAELARKRAEFTRNLRK